MSNMEEEEIFENDFDDESLDYEIDDLELD